MASPSAVLLSAVAPESTAQDLLSSSTERDVTPWFLWPLFLFEAGSTVCAFGINDLAASELVLEPAEWDERPRF